MKSKHCCNPLDLVEKCLDSEDITYFQNLSEAVYVDDKIYNYIANIVNATRKHPLVKLGVSTRGALALTSIIKATALLKNRDYVIPDDIAFIIYDVFEHRILLNSNAKINNVSVHDVLEEILNTKIISSFAS